MFGFLPFQSRIPDLVSSQQMCFLLFLYLNLQPYLSIRCKYYKATIAITAKGQFGRLQRGEEEDVSFYLDPANVPPVQPRIVA